ncbi:TPA: HNH endonuclease [Photobacterium damselae]
MLTPTVAFLFMSGTILFTLMFTLSLDNHANYDHMVALANCGFNDVSNIQLLCKECNQIGKRAGEAVTSTLYQNWY